MKKIYFLLFFVAGCTSPKPVETPPPPSPVVITDATQKLVDNRGEGSAAFYGMRNVREVLRGVYYRGGANNIYRREGKRANSNPLPPEGLANLCRAGFSDVVYFYDAHFETAEKQVSCETNAGRKNTLTYQQVSPLKGNAQEIASLMRLISRHVKDRSLGAVYGHCWNGWHASGMVAAVALRQFCGFSPVEAVQYWEKNTDGDSNYPKVKKLITDFRLLPELKLTANERAELCPAPDTMQFTRTSR